MYSRDLEKVLIILDFMMFYWKEFKLMFNDPLDQLVSYVNVKLLENESIRIIFS